MRYKIEFELPDNDTVLKDINSAYVGWTIWGYSGFTHAVPSDAPERKKGKWIDGKCSACGEHAPFWPMASTYYKSDFCPHCGADMRKENDVDALKKE